MHALNAFWGALVIGVLSLNIPSLLLAEDTPSSAYKADNTGKNSRDTAEHAKTPFNQDETGANREAAAKVRKAIVDDDSLSTYAHNVKIFAEGGQVTLRGPVKSAQEKQMVAQKAAAVVGPTNVMNELEVSK